MFNVESDNGIATARVDGKYIDAGISGDIAGLEFSVDRMRMSDAPREQRHANAVVTLDCTPAVLLQIATVILDKLDLPAFNSREWRIIENALRQVANNAEGERLDMADSIAAATGRILSIENS
jgi:hypothetical protein